MRLWVAEHPEGNDPAEQEALSSTAAEAEAAEAAACVSGQPTVLISNPRPTKKGKELLGLTWVDDEVGLCKALNTCQKSKQMCILYSSEHADEDGNKEHVSTVDEVRLWVFPA